MNELSFITSIGKSPLITEKNCEFLDICHSGVRLYCGSLEKHVSSDLIFYKHDQNPMIFSMSHYVQFMILYTNTFEHEKWENCYSTGHQVVFVSNRFVLMG